MTEQSADVIEGTLDVLIQKTPSLETRHGFGISRRVEPVSGGDFKVNPGSLLKPLQHLERAGWLDTQWRTTENSHRAKLLSLTRTRRKQLEIEDADGSRRVSAVARLLQQQA
jgi:PadR family transcriptional regulator, regulatory protein PadR